ncbi:MAG: Plug domain-containing protein [Steroidobacteraceae bacterium]
MNRGGIEPFPGASTAHFWFDDQHLLRTASQRAGCASIRTGFFNIRGVTLLDFTDMNESSVATYVDEIFVGSSAVQNGQLFDLDRIEVLRGPQGTLWGRNATGGVVNCVHQERQR